MHHGDFVSSAFREFRPRIYVFSRSFECVFNLFGLDIQLVQSLLFLFEPLGQLDDALFHPKQTVYENIVW